MPSFKHDHPTIGVIAGWQVFAGTIDSFLEHVFRGIQKSAQDNECNLMIACGIGTPPTHSELGRPTGPFLSENMDFVPVGPWNCDGLIFVPILSIEEQEQYLFHLVESGFPVISAGNGGYGPKVVPDNEDGIRQAMQHLFQHGHRKIAYIAGFEDDPDGDSGIRLKAFLDDRERFGLSLNPDLVELGYHSFRGGQNAMRKLLSCKEDFSAVIASNDRSALGAMVAIREAGLTIPQEVALIGFDDRLETRAQNPPLTTVHYPMYELGYQAVNLMLKRIANEIDLDFQLRIPTHLVVRESCGCLPAEIGAHSIQGSNFQPLQPQGAKDAPNEFSLQGAPPPKNISIEQQLSRILFTEAHYANRQEIDALTAQFIDSYRNSLLVGNKHIFLESLKQILEFVVHRDDVNTWQAAISLLREQELKLPGAHLNQDEVKDMLDQGRIMISESARVQTMRRLLRQAHVAEQLGAMTRSFFMAEDEGKIFDKLSRYLLSIGIQSAAAFYFESQGEDPVAFSSLQSPHARLPKDYRFSTRLFPPEGLFEGQEPFHLAVVPLVIEGGKTGYIALDAGPMEPMAEIVHQLESSLYAVRLRQEALNGQRLAEEANRLKSRFLSMVSHELRAPLSLISGLSDILLKTSRASTSLSEEFWTDLKRIYISAQHLDSLISDVLDLTRSDIGQLKLTCEMLDLKEVLEAAAVIGEHQANEKGLEWHFEIDRELPRVWGDRTRLRQVILNLVNNAVKFTTHGEVSLSAVVEEGYVAISVSDTGLGIPQDEQEVIFEEFRQSERTTARGYGGLGLGLAICKRLVELHGGQIRVCSLGEEDQGTVFTFTLPVIEDKMHRVEKRTRVSHAPKVLLLVKDFKRGSFLQGHLQARSYDVELHQPLNKKEWLGELLLSNPDVVVVDADLTTERGWDILKVLKENPNTAETPLFFYNLDDNQQSGALLELDYLTKPIRDDLLTDALLSYMIRNETPPVEKEQAVLIVDDDPAIVDLHTRIIQEHAPSMHLLQAVNGREALKIIRREHPKLVLLDLMMPEVDGFAVLEAMQADEFMRGIPVIVITGQSLDSESVKRLNRGVARVLSKGVFSVDEILKHITSSLQNRQKVSLEAQLVVLKSMGFIHANYHEPITRRDVAEYVGVSERHLDRCFRQELGISPITYLNRYRIHQARLLLENGKRGITEVAMEVGFSSSGYFTRVFREEVGVSPRTYVRNHCGMSN